eukprot:gene20442-biopygen8556
MLYSARITCLPTPSCNFTRIMPFWEKHVRMRPGRVRDVNFFRSCQTRSGCARNASAVRPLQFAPAVRRLSCRAPSETHRRCIMRRKLHADATDQDRKLDPLGLVFFGFARAKTIQSQTCNR